MPFNGEWPIDQQRGPARKLRDPLRKRVATCKISRSQEQAGNVERGVHQASLKMLRGRLHQIKKLPAVADRGDVLGRPSQRPDEIFAIGRVKQTRFQEQVPCKRISLSPKVAETSVPINGEAFRIQRIIVSLHASQQIDVRKSVYLSSADRSESIEMTAHLRPNRFTSKAVRSDKAISRDATTTETATMEWCCRAKVPRNTAGAIFRLSQ